MGIVCIMSYADVRFVSLSHKLYREYRLYTRKTWRFDFGQNIYFKYTPFKYSCYMYVDIHNYAHNIKFKFINNVLQYTAFWSIYKWQHTHKIRNLWPLSPINVFFCCFYLVQSLLITTKKSSSSHQWQSLTTCTILTFILNWEV